MVTDSLHALYFDIWRGRNSRAGCPAGRCQQRRQSQYRNFILSFQHNFLFFKFQNFNLIIKIMHVDNVNNTVINNLSTLYVSFSVYISANVDNFTNTKFSTKMLNFFEKLFITFIFNKTFHFFQQPLTSYHHLFLNTNLLAHGNQPVASAATQDNSEKIKKLLIPN